MTNLPNRIRIYEEGPREGFQIEKGPITDRPQDRADRCAVGDRARSHPDRLVRRSETGARHGRCRSGRARHRAQAGRGLHRPVAERARVRAARWRPSGSTSRAPSCCAARKPSSNATRTAPRPSSSPRRSCWCGATRRSATRSSAARSWRRSAAISKAMFPPRGSSTLAAQMLDMAERARRQLEYVSLADTMAWATPAIDQARDRRRARKISRACAGAASA